MKNYQSGYGVFLQEGGPMDMSASTDQQMAAEQQMGAEGQPDPQMMAEEFLQAFSQLPPEAQELVMQALSQPQ